MGGDQTYKTLHLLVAMPFAPSSFLFHMHVILSILLLLILDFLYAPGPAE